MFVAYLILGVLILAMILVLIGMRPQPARKNERPQTGEWTAKGFHPTGDYQRKSRHMRGGR
jgi:hypothetical protein